ncbi:putative chromosome-partitioning protein ParB [Abditibacteriota bacterium]|nr:putative chromosome-partitioning protein ParB [Abditibacteriota bacterium]
MSTKTAKRALGRGLSALIPESDFDLLSGFARGDALPALPTEPIASPVTAAPTPAPQISGDLKSEVRYLRVDQIEANPFQPRQVFSEEELENLASSLREHGVLQPVLVRPINNNRFQLIAGERRWRASQRAELATIPAIVRDVDDQSALELAIIENVQRHDISSLESAQAYKRLAAEFGLSQEKIAQRVGKSRAAVANTLRLLDLPSEALEALKTSQISEGHGRALLMANGEDARRALLRRTLRDGLSVRDVERFAREANATDEAGPKISRRLPGESDITRLENTLQRALGNRVQIRARARGGALVVHYNSPEELARLTQKLTAKS